MDFICFHFWEQRAQGDTHAHTACKFDPRNSVRFLSFVFFYKFDKLQILQQKESTSKEIAIKQAKLYKKVKKKNLHLKKLEKP